jgi:type I restriction enzyme S subunit
VPAPGCLESTSYLGGCDGRPNGNFWRRHKEDAIPLAPILEQENAIELVTTLLQQIANRLMQVIAEAIHRPTQKYPQIRLLRQLVPQDQNDEPASVLLERIRAERAGAIAG